MPQPRLNRRGNGVRSRGRPNDGEGRSSSAGTRSYDTQTTAETQYKTLEQSERGPTKGVSSGGECR